MAASEGHGGDYHRLPSDEDDSPPEDEEELLVHVTEGPKDSWHHIKNLDNFFTKIYHFHQKNGFACMMLSDIFELVQFLFVVAFSTFLLCCVDYAVLFANQPVNRTQPGGGLGPERSKVTLPDAVLPTAQCAQRIRASGWIIFFLVMAATFWLYRLAQVVCSLLGYWEIRAFYIKALKIPSEELSSRSWQEVQARLMALQREQPMCVQKRELSELDIHHRILRFRNYLVALVNKALLPVRFRLPLLGEVVFLTRGLLFNLELLLFRGPGSLFQGRWSLRPPCKRAGARLELARRLGRRVLLLGLANLLLCPLVLVWQALYAFFSYAEVLKRQPGSLGARRWSLYGRLYLRHFNELDHELQARLSRGYKPASQYMNSFASPLLAVLAKNAGFFAGSLLAVLLALTVYDEDVLTVEHILTAITLLGLIVTVARSFIPDEHPACCPEQLLRRLLAHVHCAPGHWQGSARKAATREELAQLFQYKASPGPHRLLPQLLRRGGGCRGHLLLRPAGHPQPRRPAVALPGPVRGVRVSASREREDGAVPRPLRHRQPGLAAPARELTLPRAPAGEAAAGRGPGTPGPAPPCRGPPGRLPPVRGGARRHAGCPPGQRAGSAGPGGGRPGGSSARPDSLRGRKCPGFALLLPAAPARPSPGRGLWLRQRQHTPGRQCRPCCDAPGGPHPLGHALLRTRLGRDEPARHLHARAPPAAAAAGAAATAFRTSSVPPAPAHATWTEASGAGLQGSAGRSRRRGGGAASPAADGAPSFEAFLSRGAPWAAACRDPCAPRHEQEGPPCRECRAEQQQEQPPPTDSGAGRAAPAWLEDPCPPRRRSRASDLAPAPAPALRGAARVCRAAEGKSRVAWEGAEAKAPPFVGRGRPPGPRPLLLPALPLLSQGPPPAPGPGAPLGSGGWPAWRTHLRAVLRQ